MTTAEEGAAQEIVAAVQMLLEDLVQDNAGGVAAVLMPDSFLDVGRQLFGLDAISVPLGFAAGLHHLSLTTVQAGEEAAVVELQGRNADEQHLSSSSVFLAREAGAWRIEDIWPVPLGEDLVAETIPEPTGLFYTGELQLEPARDATLDSVEALLVPKLQETGMGLHLVERGVHLWRTYRAATEPEVVQPAAWAAALHLMLVLLEEQEPDVTAVIAAYGALEESVVEHLAELGALLNIAEHQEEHANQQASSPIITPGMQILDSSGKPLHSSSRDNGAGRIILPYD